VKKALVLSGETPSACAVVRGLHAVGFEVTVLAEAWHSPAALSRCCATSLHVGAWKPADLERVAEEVAADVVVPVTENDLVRLVPVRAGIERRSKIVAPTPQAHDEATDKVFTSKAAEALGIAVPPQWVLAAKDGAPTSPPAAFPLIVKPSRSRALNADGTVGGATAKYADDLGTLRALFEAHAALGLDTIVQTFVEGDAVLASVLLREDGAPSLVFAHRRVREARPEGGPSACALSIDPDARVVVPAIDLARALGVVRVPAQFEFRFPRIGAPVLLDVNPRPWGTLGLALDCGVNFYGLAARHALGDALPAPPPPYRAGVERHYLPFELKRAATTIFGTPAPGFPGPWPEKWAAGVEWMFLPNEGLVGKLDDPLPAFGDLVRLAAKAIS